MLGSHEFDPMGHETPKIDLETLQALAKENLRTPDGLSTIVEVGSWAGLTARAMASIDSVDVIYCVDHWKGSPDGDYFGDPLGKIVRDRGWINVFSTFCRNIGPDLMRRVIPLVGTSEQYAKIWPFQVGMVFLDGDHEKCERDIELWLPHVLPGGILCGHDYAVFPAVTAAAEKLANSYDVRVIGQMWFMKKEASSHTLASAMACSR